MNDDEDCKKIVDAFALDGVWDQAKESVPRDWHLVESAFASEVVVSRYLSKYFPFLKTKPRRRLREGKLLP